MELYPKQGRPARMCARTTAKVIALERASSREVMKVNCNSIRLHKKTATLLIMRVNAHMCTKPCLRRCTCAISLSATAAFWFRDKDFNQNGFAYSSSPCVSYQNQNSLSSFTRTPSCKLQRQTDHSHAKRIYHFAINARVNDENQTLLFLPLRSILSSSFE